MNSGTILSDQEVAWVCTILRASTSPLRDKATWTEVSSRIIVRSILAGLAAGTLIASMAAMGRWSSLSWWIVILAGLICGSVLGALVGGFLTDRARAARRDGAQYMADRFTRTTGGKSLLSVTQTEADEWMRQQMARSP